MGGRAFGRIASLGIGLLGACHRTPPPAPPPPKPMLGAIVVLDAASHGEGEAPFDGASLEPALRARLLGTGMFSSDAADAAASPVAQLQVQIATEAIEAGAKGQARARVGLRLESRPVDAPGALSFDLEGQAAAPYAVVRPRVPAARRALLSGLVLRIAGDLIDGFVARRRLHDGPVASVHAALVADGGELRDEAIRAVGERRLDGEAPVLLALLNDPDETTRDAALGALIALHDRRAVTELTRTRSLRDRHEMRKIIEAIAILGGQEADDYLSFVAASHDDDEIRAAAAAARARLERREAEAGTPSAEAPK
jgi:hypothetical protein